MSIQERDRIRQIAGFLATALGDGWTVDTDPIWAENTSVPLDGPNRARIFVRIGMDARNRGRLVIHGAFPQNYLSGLHEITVTADSDPARIAAEIRRRLLPNYLIALAAAYEKKAGDEADQKAQAEANDRLVAASNGMLSHGGYLTLHEKYGYGDVRVSIGGRSASLDLRGVPIEKAEAIIRLLTQEV